DLADLLRPKVVLIENVPGFGRVDDGRLLGRVRVRLVQSGYQTAVRNLCAVSFGVPQTRTRCFIFAIRSDLGWPNLETLLDRCLCPTHVWPSLEFPNGHSDLETRNNMLRAVTVADAIDDLPPLEAGEGIPETKLTTQ